MDSAGAGLFHRQGGNTSVTVHWGFARRTDCPKSSILCFPGAQMH